MSSKILVPFAVATMACLGAVALSSAPASAYDGDSSYSRPAAHRISFVGRVGERATDYQSPSGVTSVCPKVRFNIFDSQDSRRGDPRIRSIGCDS
jgi:hypothetical protein